MKPLLICLACFIAPVCSLQNAPSPFLDIRLDELRALAFVGSFHSFSSALNPQPNPFLNSQEALIETLSLYRRTNATMNQLASFDGTSLDAMCVLTKPDASGVEVFIGGSFSKVKDLQTRELVANNVVSYDPASGKFSSLLSGVDGPVRSLHCDSATATVYVGGDFKAPVNEGATSRPYDSSIPFNVESTFGGSVAKWTNSRWSPMEFKGLDGPVNTIISSVDDKFLYFGGRFDATRDGEDALPPATRRLNLAVAEIRASNAEPDPTLGDPKNIICPKNERVWLLRAGKVGSWTMKYPMPFTPSVIRIKNTNFQTRGVKTFRIISRPDNDVLSLAYREPSAGTRVTCRNACPLEQAIGIDGDLTFRDFIVQDSTETLELRIEIIDAFGPSPGLAGIEIYQAGILTHSVQEYNVPNCPNENFVSTNQVRLIGDWTEIQSLSNPSNKILTLDYDTTLFPSKPPSIIYSPGLPESGLYVLQTVTPGCGDNCGSRGLVDYTIRFGGGAKEKPVVITVSQNTPQDKKETLYTGFFNVDDPNFLPSVTISVRRSSVNPAVFGVIVADALQWVKKSLPSGFNGLLQYTLKNATAGTVPTWSAMKEVFPQNAEVTSLVSMKPSKLFIGGSFSGVNYTNIVIHDETRLVPLPNGGLDGRVESMVKGGSADLYVGGAFTTDANKRGISLKGLARFNSATGEWTSVSGGVNGSVTKLGASKNDTRITVSGAFNELLPDGPTPSNFAGARIASLSAYSISQNGWASDIPLVDGRVQSYSTVAEQKDSTVEYFGGQIKQADYLQSSGVGFLNPAGLPGTWGLKGIDSLPDIIPSFPYSIHTALVVDSLPGLDVSSASKNGSLVIVGGRFQTRNGAKNIALWNTTAWVPFGDARNENYGGEVRTMLLTEEKLLFVGGDFIASIRTPDSVVEKSPSLAVWDLSSTGPGGESPHTLNPLRQSQPPRILPGSEGNLRPIVNVIKEKPGGGGIIIVGGDFKVASENGQDCVNVCIWDTKSNAWRLLGNGGIGGGAVYDIEFRESRVVLAGNFTSPSPYVVEYDFDGSIFISSSDALPGPAVSLANDPVDPKRYYVSGQSGYTRQWNGTHFTTLKSLDLLAGSEIRHVRVIGSRGDPVAESTLPEGQFLLAAGKNLQWTADADGQVVAYDVGVADGTSQNRVQASVAVYDGYKWFPLLRTPTGSQVNMVFGLRSIEIPIERVPVSIPLLVLYAVLISVAAVSVIVAFGLVFVYIRRKREREEFLQALSVNAAATKRASEGRYFPYARASSDIDRDSVRGRRELYSSMIDDDAMSGYIHRNDGTRGSAGVEEDKVPRSQMATSPEAAKRRLESLNSSISIKNVPQFEPVAIHSSRDEALRAVAEPGFVFRPKSEYVTVETAFPNVTERSFPDSTPNGTNQGSIPKTPPSQSTDDTQDSSYPTPPPRPPARTSRIETSYLKFPPMHDRLIGTASDGRSKAYYAKYPFKAREPGELGFDVGERLMILDDSDDIWYLGWVDRGTSTETVPTIGVFPSTYIQTEPPECMIPPSPPNTP